MKTSSGFTVVEMLVTIVFLSVVALVIVGQHQTWAMVHRDHDRKVAINAIHHNLQEVVKPKLGGYPRLLTAASLTAMDASLLKDPSGVAVGMAGSDYRYEPTGCNGGDICAAYTLSADLERERDYIQTSP